MFAELIVKISVNALVTLTRWMNDAFMAFPFVVFRLRSRLILVTVTGRDALALRRGLGRRLRIGQADRQPKAAQYHGRVLHRLNSGVTDSSPRYHV